MTKNVLFKGIQHEDGRIIILSTSERRICVSEAKNKKYEFGWYNYQYDLKSGFFARWGKTYEEDPAFAPAPEILDLEISVNGCPNGCAFCYKGNDNSEPINMSFDTFKKIIDKMPTTLCQVAFGITGIKTNPDFLKMMKYCRSINVVPNFTLSGIDLDDKMAEECSKLVGALAVSAYSKDKNVCYDTVKKFTDLGIKQTNIHLMISEETLKFAYEVLNDSLTDKRLENLNAIVFLSVKNKGRAKVGFKPLKTKEYTKLINFCLENNISFGFDSCSAPKFESSLESSNIEDVKKEELIQMSESCESFGLFSSYINVYGDYYPCSFAEGEKGWENGISVLNCEDFIKDVWMSEKLNNYREKSLSTCYKSGCRKCLIFDDINPQEWRKKKIKKKETK